MRKLIFLLSLAASVQAQQPVSRPVVVASKPFGESFLLAEMFAQLLEDRGVVVDRRPGLGATEITFRALQENAIDVYPEYTGTGLLVILADPPLPSSLAADQTASYSLTAETDEDLTGSFIAYVDTAAHEFVFVVSLE